MLVIKDLNVRYPQAKEKALSNVNLTFENEEFVCVLGKSGAGKSTLIRCINGLQTSTSGSINWQGLRINDLKENELRKVRCEMGMIFQHFNLIPRMNILQNVLTGMFGKRKPIKNLLGIFSQEERERAHKVIEEVELSEHMFRRVEELSGGQKQRVGIARALLQQPKVFLGDEPVASLDPGTAHKIMQLIKTIHNKHKLLTIINVHDVTLAKKYATRIIALKEGKVIFNGYPETFNEEMYHLVYETNEPAFFEQHPLVMSM
ncbi:phosphonate ABC transporter ATP-binding protein [Metabacillus herbersteinensis]|uniref:Phosphonate ABC transporter ATP-binding protein n=1 Tax=Metabacillus herbersteinensis TaxID=283816 RepID=A0ABV6GBZ3_9BACI